MQIPIPMERWSLVSFLSPSEGVRIYVPTMDDLSWTETIRLLVGAPPSPSDKTAMGTALAVALNLPVS